MRRAHLAAISAAALVLAPLSAHAQSLDDAIAIAHETSPVLDAADARVDGARARLTQARSALLPQITARGQYAEAETDFGAGTVEIEPRSSAISAEQLIFSGGRAIAGVRQARAGRDATIAERNGIRAALTADVAETYLAVVSSRRAVQLRRANLDALTQLAEHEQLRFDTGDIPRSQLAQAQARRANAQAALALARAEAAAAASRFRRIVGVEPGELDAAATPPETPTGLEEAIRTAQDANPQLIALREAEGAAAAGVWRAAAQHAPTVAVRKSES